MEAHNAPRLLKDRGAILFSNRRPPNSTSYVVWCGQLRNAWSRVASAVPALCFAVPLRPRFRDLVQAGTVMLSGQGRRNEQSSKYWSHSTLWPSTAPWLARPCSVGRSRPGEMCKISLGAYDICSLAMSLILVPYAWASFPVGRATKATTYCRLSRRGRRVEADVVSDLCGHPRLVRGLVLRGRVSLCRCCPVCQVALTHSSLSPGAHAGPTFRALGATMRCIHRGGRHTFASIFEWCCVDPCSVVNIPMFPHISLLATII